ncbi:MoaD/ThiS family protein [Crenobacter cavernae]|uniref:MoaD/ThiS family protein n=1 Tax=Crenobacter cavernae TaxID=2290923 RepID=A0A345Y9G0_9NEIS|nr:MoaD/ThiS family protein [Crenobacter cavernae]AXK40562.1 MoaD/ThiS family protein [Crenobacter cavernae]
MSALVVIRIPTPLRTYTEGADEVAVQADTVGEALASLFQRHEGIGERILGPDGEPRPFVNIYLGKADVRARQGLSTPVKEGDVIAIVPAVAGGRHESER